MSQPQITKETLEYLAALARIRLDPSQEPKLVADLQKILEYVSELQEVDTSGVEPMNGGTLLSNVFREDGSPQGTNRGAGTELFPEAKDDYLKILPVFGGEKGTGGSSES